MVTMSARTDSAVTGLTQMGGEGSQWIGQAPFTDVDHLFQNIGDGTFFHSGQLAVQACVAAGVNITYKLLYNEVVAMTGAQDAEGALAVPELTHKLHGRRRRADHRLRRRTAPPRQACSLATGTVVWHRDRLDEAQRQLRDVPGVTVLIYDQHCAADARRQRKRGTLPDAHHPGRHQRSGVRGLRRLRRQVQLPVRAAGRHRATAARRGSTRPRATPTTAAWTATARRS